jgi:hypothetical protein
MKNNTCTQIVMALILGTLSVAAHADATVGYSATADEGNFGTPSNVSDSVGYTISMTSDPTDVNLVLTTTPTTDPVTPVDGNLNFTNLYFSTSVVSGTGGSTVGFEIQNEDAFIPGVPGSVSTQNDGITFNQPKSGEWDISIPWQYFETDPDNLGFTKISATNDVVRLNLSQSFGYSVAGGQANYGDMRLGEAILSTPEPSSYALGGIVLVTFAVLRSRFGRSLVA